MNHQKKKKSLIKRQSGVTLLLSLLILSAITAISFSLATILFVEIRSSGDLSRTEPALYAANGITEEALYNVKRSTGVTTYSSSVGSVSTTNSSSSFHDAVQRDKILTTSNTFAGTRNRYAFYDPTNPYSAGGYSRVKVTFLNTNSGGTLNIYLCQFDPLDSSATCSDVGNTTYMIFRDTNPAPLSAGGVWDSLTDCGCTLDPTKQQELVLYQTGATSDMYVQIETYDGSGIAKGLPYFGETAVDVVAAGTGVTRKIRTIIPTPNAASSGMVDTIWLEDSNSASYVSASKGFDGGDSWAWVSSSPTPYSGTEASRSNIASGEHQHYFNGATSKLTIATGDSLYAYVYIDPANLPTEVMLQWNSDSQGWNHRAYWGANVIPWGIDGTTSRYYMGPLPASGSWVRLQVPASSVGLEGQTVNGIAFTLNDGRATWDQAGKSVVTSGAPVTCGSSGSGTFNACYYSDRTLTTSVLNRTDAYPLTFDWSTGSPDPIVPNDNFSAMWTGDFNFASGSHTFTVRADDGVRLYIDGAMVINQWIDQGPTTYTYTTSLTGTHTIRMEYYENGGGAVANLSWN